MCWNSPRLSIFWPIAVASAAVHPSYFIIHFIARRPTKHRGINLKRWKCILASTLFLIFRARSFNRSISSFLGQFPAKSHAYLREISHFCCISSDGNDICHFTSWLPRIVRTLQSSVPLMCISNFEMSLPSAVVVIAVTALPGCNRMLWRRPLRVPFKHKWRWLDKSSTIKQLQIDIERKFEVSHDYLHKNKTITTNILRSQWSLDISGGRLKKWIKLSSTNLLLIRSLQNEFK